LLEQIKLLVELQRIDTERLDLEREAAEGPARIAELEADWEALVKESETAEAALEPLRSRHKELEATVEANQSKMKRSQARLPMIKNNKEYRASLKEMDDLKRMNFELEDEILELLERLETLEAEQVERRKRLDEIKTELDENRQAILDRVAQCRTLIEALEVEREKVRAAVDRETLDQYDHVAYARGGQALAAIRGGTCQACFMNLTPHQYQVLQHMDRLMTCPSCHRLIYWVEHEDLSPPEAPESATTPAGEAVS
jgi:predicted  nucleic acid-binding Zn-ribbon protein